MKPVLTSTSKSCAASVEVSGTTPRWLTPGRGSDKKWLGGSVCSMAASIYYDWLQGGNGYLNGNSDHVQ